MAQKRRRAATRAQGTSSSGQGRSRNRRGATGRRAARAQVSRGQELRAQVTRAYSAAGKTAAGGARRLLAEARDVAQSVGETTIGTARGIASGAKGAAVGVANRTQDAAMQVAGKVRENPWPAVLIGAGATWMVIDAARGDERSQGRTGERGVRNARRRGNRSEGNVATQALSAVADAGRSVGGRVGRFVRENPLLVGGTALGLGVAVGLALPSTVTENEMLGSARDAVVNRAKETARSTVRGVRDVAEGVGRLAGRD